MFGDPSCIGFWDIVRNNRQTHRQTEVNALPRHCRRHGHQLYVQIFYNKYFIAVVYDKISYCIVNLMPMMLILHLTVSNASFWRPSVCPSVRPSVCSISFLAMRIISTQCDQRTLPSAYYEDGNTCSDFEQLYSPREVAYNNIEQYKQKQDRTDRTEKVAEQRA